MGIQGMISIHAPVKGATPGEAPGEHTHKISIHAPVKGATDKLWDTDTVFQISIHAPVKGATTSTCSPSPGPTYFNPRSREGSDLIFRPSHYSIS